MFLTYHKFVLKTLHIIILMVFLRLISNKSFVIKLSVLMIKKKHNKKKEGQIEYKGDNLKIRFL